MSVVVPTVDRPVELRRAVASILEQDYPGAIEVLVVFDGRVPLAPDVPTGPGRELRVLTNQRTQGLAGNRNTGYLAASGELLAACDDDDEWLPGKLRAQVELLRRRPDAGLIATGLFVNFQATDTERERPEADLSLTDLLRDRHQEIHPSSFLLTRERVFGPDGIGLVDEQLPGGYAEDYDWMLRAARVGPLVSVPDPLVRAYWHESSFFVSRWQTVEDALRFLLAKTPEFAEVPAGLARIEGQLAFANAALGRRRAAVRIALTSIRRWPRVPQAWAALAVAAHLVTPAQVLALARRAGKGI